MLLRDKVGYIDLFLDIEGNMVQFLMFKLFGVYMQFIRIRVYVKIFISINIYKGKFDIFVF